MILAHEHGHKIRSHDRITAHFVLFDRLGVNSRGFDDRLSLTPSIPGRKAQLHTS